MQNNMVNTRQIQPKINRKQSPDTGIEPENSDMPEKRATFTPPGHLFSHSLSYYKYTLVNNIV